VWFGNYQSVESGAGFGGDSAAPIFRQFMTAALQDAPDTPLPPPGPVCARPGATVNPTGGHGAAVLPPAVVSPDLPAVAPTTPTTAPATPTAPATTAPATTPTAPPVSTPANQGTGQGGSGP
jgi:membrane peptidoglycan carboxypeptidase